MMNRPPPPKFEPIQTPHVVFQPQTYRSVQKGIHTLVAAIRPTLGPLPRNVAIEKISTNSSPELLDNGGVIARRIIELQDPDEDIGAMLARGFLWELHSHCRCDI
jgi:chaperonin GroEL (HSP60 family)